MHFIPKYLLYSIIIVLCSLSQYCLSQSTTVRPYKFGFTIDQQQHRSEKRDERGIVMGEFGFITADGIYHVTVYATDEQGRFRILAMKNYPYESPPKTVEVMVKLKTPIKTTTTPKPLTRHNFNTEACSGCFLVNGDNKPKDVNGLQGKTLKNNIRPLSKPLPSEAETPTSPKLPNQPSTASRPTASGTKTATGGNNPPIMDIIMQKVLPTLMGSKGSIPKTLNSKSNVVPSGIKPSSKSGSGTGIGTSSSASGDGDLYRFKYILDYNGHSETGKRNGNKEGSYYSIGDDNVERTIEYVANEFGYQPRIRWRKLDTNEIKSKENTLKDYEFVWFN